LSSRIAESLSIASHQAEQEKVTKGITSKQMLDVLSPLLDVIITDIQRATSEFSEKERKEIQKIVLGGGSALLPGLKEYMAEALSKKAEIIDPFSNIFYPPILEGTMKKAGPAFAVAVGMALRGLA
jgi:type IV pilus assembly protein PilM